MTRSIIGTNAALRYLKSYTAHVDYWHDVNPAYQLAYVDKPEHTNYIQEYAAAFPDSMIVARIRHKLDGGFHLAPTGKDDNRYYVAAPVDYHRDFGFLGRIDNVVLSVMNEPNGFGSDDEINRLTRWMVDYIGIAVREKTKSVLFNWGDRQPRINESMMDNRFDIVLQLMSAHPELFFFGMHFYGPDDITQHIESYVTRCERIGIIPPRVIGSEFGYDKTDGAASGYKSRGVGGGEYAAWQISQVKHDLAPYIKRGVLVGLNVFQEGNSGGWESFDYENDKPYKDEIKRAAQAGELMPMVTPPTPTPIPPPKPAVVIPAGLGVAKSIVIAGKASWNLRTDADIHAPEVGLVKVGEAITLYHSTVQPNGGSSWYYIERASAPAGESANGWLAYVLPVTGSLPNIPAPPSAYMRLYQAQLKVAQITHDLSQAQLELAQLYRELDNETTGKAA